MIDKALLASIAQQMLSGNTVSANGKSLPVRRTSQNRLKTLTFIMDGCEYQAIEQNPEKPSRWGRLARDGHQVVQFKDSETNKFVAVSVDGKSLGVWGRARNAERLRHEAPSSMGRMRHGETTTRASIAKVSRR